MSPRTVWLAAIASTVVTCLLIAGWIWLDSQATPTHTVHYEAQTEASASGWEVFFILLLCGAIVLGPGILVALIVLPIIRKNKRK